METNNAGEKRELISTLIIILITCFAANFALIYWWWARIYIFSGTIFAVSLFILVQLNPLVLFLITRNAQEFLNHLDIQKKSFVLPLAIGFFYMVLHLFGVIDITTHRYLYRNLFIMIAIGISLIYALIQKIIFYNAIFERKMNKIILVLLIDLITLTIYALLLTNIEGLLT